MYEEKNKELEISNIFAMDNPNNSNIGIELNKRQIDILDNIFFNDRYILFQKDIDSNIQLYQDLLLLEHKKYITRNSFDCETYIFEMTKKGNDYIKKFRVYKI